MPLLEMRARDDDYPERHPVFDEMWELPPVVPGDRVITIAGYAALREFRTPVLDPYAHYDRYAAN